MKRVVECVPNFSEGREIATIDAICNAIASVRGVFLLDRSSDPDHNRSVVTMAGEPNAVLEAALRAVGKAAELIDLRTHTGAHPRIGATDVLPFVPVSGVTLEDCAGLARRAGREIWERYGIPVYFYQAAATRPERVNLENLRRGNFEGLRNEVLRDPERAPDVGDPRLHLTAGATAVAARKFLIAYNINLNSNNLKIAQRIAQAVRQSGGGLPHVKAMAVDLRTRGLAQVSMNLTDYQQTSLQRVFEMVKREAERHGVAPAFSEIVGLVPRTALESAAAHYLQLENFSSTQVFENRLESAENERADAQAPPAEIEVPETEVPLPATATPLSGLPSAAGGVSAADVAAGLAQSLTRVATRVAGNAAQLTAFASRLDAAAKSLASLAERDNKAFASVVAAHELPHDANSNRQRAIQQALQRAAEIPLATARAAVEIFEVLGQLETVSSPSILSEVRAAREEAAVAARSALHNAATHLESIAGPAGGMRHLLQTLAERLGPQARTPEPKSSRVTR